MENAAQIARNEAKTELLAEVALATDPYARSTVDFPLRWSLLNELLPHVARLEAPTQVRVISAWVNEGTVSNQGLTDVSLATHTLDVGPRRRRRCPFGDGANGDAQCPPGDARNPDRHQYRTMRRRRPPC